MQEKNLLKYCCRLVEEKQNWGVGSLWVNSQFEKLSFEIFKKTKTTVSTATLKRIFQKHPMSEFYKPQRATLDALARYVDFDNWNDFEDKNKMYVDNYQRVKQTFKKSKVLLLLAFAFLGILYLFFQFHGKAIFSPRNLVGFNFHTIYIDYSITKKGNFEIDFDENGRVQLDKNKSTLAYYYQLPGVYYGAILKNNQPIKTFATEIKTEGWQAYANLLSTNNRYHPVKNFISDSCGTMQVSMHEVAKLGIDTLQTFWTHLCNSISDSIDGDNFEFETSIKNNYNIADVRCNHVVVEIFGEHEKFKLYFVKDGCSKWVNVRFSNVALNGEFADLSPFATNIAEWNKLKVVVQNKNCTVLLNNKVVYKCKYNDSVGLLKSLRYSFTGSGSVKEYKFVNVH